MVTGGGGKRGEYLWEGVRTVEQQFWEQCCMVGNFVEKFLRTGGQQLRDSWVVRVWNSEKIT